MDYTITSLEALQNIKRTIGNSIPLFVDGGFQSSNEIFKALALGANGVLLGRPLLWALTVCGANKLEEVIGSLNNELIHTMT